MKYFELTEKDEEVLGRAVDASNRLYVSGIQEVGAAVQTSSGQIFSGIHFNTSSPFATICGEISAICCMVSAGQRDLLTVAAVWRSEVGKHFLLPPCGRCRAVIRDFNAEAWVIVSMVQDNWDEGAIAKPGKVRIADLLPL